MTGPSSTQERQVGASVEVLGNYIGGRWAVPDGVALIPNLNPADAREVICQSPDSGRESVREAIAAASAAYKTWRKVSAPQRGKLVAKAAQIMEARREQIAAAE